jgi:hypothetical protein
MRSLASCSLLKPSLLRWQVPPHCQHNCRLFLWLSVGLDRVDTDAVGSSLTDTTLEAMEASWWLCHEVQISRNTPGPQHCNSSCHWRFQNQPSREPYCRRWRTFNLIAEESSPLQLRCEACSPSTSPIVLRCIRPANRNRYIAFRPVGVRFHYLISQLQMCLPHIVPLLYHPGIPHPRPTNFDSPITWYVQHLPLPTSPIFRGTPFRLFRYHGSLCGRVIRARFYRFYRLSFRPWRPCFLSQTA